MAVRTGLIVHKVDGPLIIESPRFWRGFYLRCDDCHTISRFDRLSDARDAFDAHTHQELG